jgi:L,D-transpeptidase ErfK/SrfK
MRRLLLPVLLAAAAAGCLTLMTTALAAQSLAGRVHTVVVVRGDTLPSLGARFGVDPATIARDNERAPDAALQVGEMLRIDNRHVVPAVDRGLSLAVNLPQRMLFLTHGTEVTAYPAAVGRPDWPTPVGAFSIVSKEVNPTWDVPESIRTEARRAGRSLPKQVPPGPNNPLGAYWLGLSAGSIGIHGTNAPTTVYQAATHGCIRLHPADIAALFGHVQVGSEGLLLYQPVLVGVDGDDIFVEVHRDVYRRGPHDPLEFVRARARELGVFERVDWDRAAAVIRQRDGVARAVTRQDGFSGRPPT